VKLYRFRRLLLLVFLLIKDNEKSKMKRRCKRRKKKVKYDSFLLSHKGNTLQIERKSDLRKSNTEVKVR
jgi:hypothetical protein